MEVFVAWKEASPLVFTEQKLAVLTAEADLSHQFTAVEPFLWFLLTGVLPLA